MKASRTDIFTLEITECSCYTCQDAVSLARTEEEPEAAALKLAETAFSRGSADNITCIVVKFHHGQAKTDSAQG